MRKETGKFGSYSFNNLEVSIMTNIVDLASVRREKQAANLTSSDEALAQILFDLKATVARMETLGKELLVTQQKLERAEKRAQWAQQSMDNLRGLCVQYIKSECSLNKAIKNRDDTIH
ncbi:hypothetical protein A9Q81_13710 [Gammaproteobacteria bacterium 42_54_T18]|nr:hypothetical protein A9Q81_13710 [Gammaproteobacteria bacterium 42_54_T18]